MVHSLQQELQEKELMQQAEIDRILEQSNALETEKNDNLIKAQQFETYSLQVEEQLQTYYKTIQSLEGEKLQYYNDLQARTQENESLTKHIHDLTTELSATRNGWEDAQLKYHQEIEQLKANFTQESVEKMHYMTQFEQLQKELQSMYEQVHKLDVSKQQEMASLQKDYEEKLKQQEKESQRRLKEELRQRKQKEDEIIGKLKTQLQENREKLAREKEQTQFLEQELIQFEEEANVLSGKLQDYEIAVEELKQLVDEQQQQILELDEQLQQTQAALQAELQAREEEQLRAQEEAEEERRRREEEQNNRSVLGIAEEDEDIGGVDRSQFRVSSQGLDMLDLMKSHPIIQELQARILNLEEEKKVLSASSGVPIPTTKVQKKPSVIPEESLLLDKMMEITVSEASPSSSSSVSQKNSETMLGSPAFILRPPPALPLSTANQQRAAALTSTVDALSPLPQVDSESSPDLSKSRRKKDKEETDGEKSKDREKEKKHKDKKSRDKGDDSSREKSRHREKHPEKEKIKHKAEVIEPSAVAPTTVAVEQPQALKTHSDDKSNVVEKVAVPVIVAGVIAAPIVAQSAPASSSGYETPVHDQRVKESAKNVPNPIPITSTSSISRRMYGLSGSYSAPTSAMSSPAPPPPPATNDNSKAVLDASVDGIEIDDDADDPMGDSSSFSDIFVEEVKHYCVDSTRSIAMRKEAAKKQKDANIQRNNVKNEVPIAKEEVGKVEAVEEVIPPLPESPPPSSPQSSESNSIQSPNASDSAGSTYGSDTFDSPSSGSNASPSASVQSSVTEPSVVSSASESPQSKSDSVPDSRSKRSSSRSRSSRSSHSSSSQSSVASSKVSSSQSSVASSVSSKSRRKETIAPSVDTVTKPIEPQHIPAIPTVGSKPISKDITVPSVVPDAVPVVVKSTTTPAPAAIKPAVHAAAPNTASKPVTVAAPVQQATTTTTASRAIPERKPVSTIPIIARPLSTVPVTVTGTSVGVKRSISHSKSREEAILERVRERVRANTSPRTLRTFDIERHRLLRRSPSLSPIEVEEVYDEEDDREETETSSVAETVQEEEDEADESSMGSYPDEPTEGLTKSRPTPRAMERQTLPVRGVAERDRRPSIGTVQSNVSEDMPHNTSGVNSSNMSMQLEDLETLDSVDSVSLPFRDTPQSLPDFRAATPTSHILGAPTNAPTSAPSNSRVAAIAAVAASTAAMISSNTNTGYASTTPSQYQSQGYQQSPAATTQSHSQHQFPTAATHAVPSSLSSSYTGQSSIATSVPAAMTTPTVRKPMPRDHDGFISPSSDEEDHKQFQQRSRISASAYQSYYQQQQQLHQQQNVSTPFGDTTAHGSSANSSTYDLSLSRSSSLLAASGGNVATPTAAHSTGGQSHYYQNPHQHQAYNTGNPYGEYANPYQNQYEHSQYPQQSHQQHHSAQYGGYDYGYGNNTPNSYYPPSGNHDLMILGEIDESNIQLSDLLNLNIG